MQADLEVCNHNVTQSEKQDK